MKKYLAFCLLVAFTLTLFGCACDHEWVPANCETPSICLKCGQNSGEVLGHKWMEATCISKKVCEICGKEMGEAKGHSWEPATCTTEETCKVCGEKKGGALGHEWQAVTCTEDGFCSRCGKKGSKALGHNVVEWETVLEATCSEEGEKQGSCARCEQFITAEIEKSPHSEGDWVITERATLQGDGKREKVCTVCGQVTATESYSLSEEEYVEAYKNQCDSYTYEEIARNPDSYVGKYAMFTGEVIQVLQENSGKKITYTLRVNVTKNGNYYTYYSDTILVVYTAEADDDRILEDDIVKMYGILGGDYTYESVMGSEITLPLFYAEYIFIQ